MTGTDLTISEDSGAPVEQAATEYLPAGQPDGDASPRVPASGRRAEIEAIMKTDIERYYSEGLDREHLALLEAEHFDPESPESAAVPLSWQESRESMMASPDMAVLARDWQRDGGFEQRLQNVQKTVAGMVDEIGDGRAQRAFMERFDRDVPEPVRAVVYDDLAMGVPYAAPASEAEVKRFAETPAGAELVKEWGTFAADQVGILRTRASRIADRLFDEEIPVFFGWLDGLDVKAAKAIFRKLADG